jgi:NAD+ kinase
MPTPIRIGLIGKRSDPRAAHTLAACAHLLLERRAAGWVREVLVCSDTALEAPGVEAVSAEELARRSELAVVVGGDGTLLAAGRLLAPHGVPILGVNQGRLGFMVDVRPEELGEALDALLNGEAIVEERMLLSARVLRGGGGPIGEEQLAVNDVVLRNQASIRMLEFETWLGQGGQWEFISRHRADGLIVATPTGSTAYALSGGGPVLHPAVLAIALVPICPHTLSDRPIVVPADRGIRIVPCGEATGAALTYDGQLGAPLDAGDMVEIARAPRTLRLLHPPRYNYFELLRDKLHWGRSPAGVIDRA